MANIIVKDLRPLSFVDGIGFKEFIAATEPGLKDYGRKSMTGIIKKNYESEHKNLKQILVSVGNMHGVNCTIDTWTSSANESLMSVTAHYIDQDWELRHYLLSSNAIVGRHTAENIKSHLEEVKEDFGTKIFCVTHDNAANMNLAMEISGEIQEDIGCFAHSLQLAIGKALQNETIQHLIAVVSQNSRFFRKSGPGWQCLKAKQLEKNPTGQPVGPIMEVATRWNSTFYMVERLHTLQEFIDDIWLNEESLKMEMKKANVAKPKQDHWYLASRLVKVLRPFEQMTEFWSGSQYVTLSTAIPVLFAQLDKLDPKQKDLPAIFAFKECLKSELVRRFKLTAGTVKEAHYAPYLACFLDPRFKALPFIENQLKNNVLEKVTTRMHSVELKDVAKASGVTNVLQEDDSSDSNSENDEPEAKKAKGLKVLLGAYFQANPQEPMSQTVEQELKRFKEAAQSPSDGNPLLWWKENEKSFPRLGALAKCFLSIPATSVPSEAAFSKAGYVTEKRRSRLSSAHVNEILFLHFNGQLTRECSNVGSWAASSDESDSEVEEI